LADVDGTLVTQEKVLTRDARQVVAQLGQAGDLVCHCQRSAAARHADPDQGPEHLDGGQLVMLKVTLPEEDNFYADCIKHPNVLKVVALSGGYSPQRESSIVLDGFRTWDAWDRQRLTGFLEELARRGFVARETPPQGVRTPGAWKATPLGLEARTRQDFLADDELR
jgi:hypothetical protein